jgi:hypothetical protein
MKYLISILVAPLLIILLYCHISEDVVEAYHYEAIEIYKNQELEIMIRDTAIENGCDPDLMIQLALLESDLDPSIKIKDSNLLYSYSLYQFQLYTFTEQLNKHNLIGKKLTYEEARDYIMNPELQTKLACEMLKEGQEWRWKNSFKKLDDN